MSARLRVVVADDERPARSFLVALLRSFEDVAVVGEASSGREAVAMIEKEKPDLAFLDWQMPELDGFGVVRLLSKKDVPMVAFVTVHDEHAIRAFELNAVDYLLKPFDDDRLNRSIDRAKQKISAGQHSELADQLRSLLAAKQERWPQRLVVRSGERFDMVWVFDLDATSGAYRFSQVPELLLDRGEHRVEVGEIADVRANGKASGSKRLFRRL